MTKLQEKKAIEGLFPLLPPLGETLNHIDSISSYLDTLPEIPQLLANKLKARIQSEAIMAWDVNGMRGFIVAATGVGKSKIAIDISVDLCMDTNGVKPISPNILLVVPTEQLRDNNWKDEFEKWGAIEIYNHAVQGECYVSINKIHGQHYDLVILDEAHNITEANSQFFAQNTVDRVLALSATYPVDKIKTGLLRNLGLHIDYNITLDDAVKLRLVAPYEILIVETRLDSVDKYVKAGSKDKPFFQSEAAAYAYMNTKINALMYSKASGAKKALTWKYIARMHFIYGLKSKDKAAQFILSKIPQGERVLTFCSTIEQAELLADWELPGNNPITFHSKSDDRHLIQFQNLQIDRLTCVKALNEGMNIPSIDYGVIVQLDSNPLNTVQRIGRGIRYKSGHVGKIIIIISVDTKDNDWCTKALEKLDQSKIRRVRYENLVNGSDKID